MARRSTLRLAACPAARDPKARVPAHGHGTSCVKLTCMWRRTAITGRSARSRNGFLVSVERQRVF
jgi:hypothetical protein